MPYFSFIIPVYNTDQYLRDCLDSIKSQSFLDWECICIDDGSSDRSVMLLQKYAMEDPRFKVFHQVNSGVSKARNSVLKQIHGKYFTFIDSDDIVDRNMLENWHDILIKNNSDILVEVKPLVAFIEKKDIKFSSEKPCDLLVNVSSETAFRFCYIQNADLPFGYICKKAYKAISTKNNCFKEDISLSEDADYFLNFFSRDLTWTFVSLNSYYYRTRLESAVFSLTPQKRLSGFLVYVKYMEHLKKIGGTSDEINSFWFHKRSAVSWWVRGPNDCWNLLSNDEKEQFKDAVRRAHKILGYYPFDFMMRVRLQFLHGYLKQIPDFLDYIVFGIQNILKKY